MKSKIICLLAFLIPVALIHFWHQNEYRLETATPLAWIFACIYVICFFIGIWKKKRYLIISLPVYIISFVLLFQLINFQSRRNEENADKLIKTLEAYKAKKGKYPNSLSELKPDYVSTVPKIWFCLFSNNYGYNYLPNENSYSLSIQIGNTKPYKIWESSMGVWQFFD